MKSNPSFEILEANNKIKERMHTGKVDIQRASKYWNDMKKQGRHDIIKCYCKKQDDIQETVFQVKYQVKLSAMKGIVEQSSKRKGGMKPTFGNTSYKFPCIVRKYIAGNSF